MSEAVPPERWQKIIEKAAEQAEGGDWRAREFLAKFLMPSTTAPAGREPIQLLRQLAAKEFVGVSDADEIALEARCWALLGTLTETDTPFPAI